MGEEFVSKIFPHWVPSTVVGKGVVQEGYDFLAPPSRRGARTKKVEVKTLSAEITVSGKLEVRVKDGAMHNQVADEFLFLSVAGIWTANGPRLRKYVDHFLSQNQRLKSLSYKEGERVFIELNLPRLLALHILHPANISSQKFRLFLAESRQKK